MSDVLPYSVEYAKSSRSSCKNCNKSIDKDSLRLAVVVQSPMHDGMMARWYHPNCFFVKQRPKSTADIANFDNIRWEDQEDVKKRVEEASTLSVPVTRKGKKRTSTAKDLGALGDYTVQYAKSSKSACKACEEKIIQGEIRISKKDFESEHGKRYGGIDRWHHLECFAKIRSDMQFFESGSILPGFTDLSKDDQKKVKSTLPKVKSSDVPPVKKLKEEPEDAEEAEAMKKQSEELYAIKDTLSTFKKSDLISMLETNNQQIPEGVSNITDRLADAIYFGALKPCPKCSGHLAYTSGTGYKCTGDLTEWTKCEYVTQDPKRKKFVISSDIQETYPELSIKCKVRKRLIKVTAPSTSSAVKKEDETDSGPKVQAPPKPLKHMEFVILGQTKTPKDILKKNVMLLGGTITTKIHENLAAAISTPKEVEKMNKRMSEIQDLDIQVISEDFFEEVKKQQGNAVELLKEKTISSWGSDPSARISVVAEKSGVAKSKSMYEKSGSGKVKLQLKGGGAVDPDSGIQDCAHVYESGKNKYTVTLVLTDIQSKKNSYYKLQILKHDKRDKFWLFRSWGRIGTTIGGTKLENLSVEECIEQFEALYEEKSGNLWSHRDNFVKVPNKMYPVDVDHGQDEISSKMFESEIKSNLHQSVQDLIRLIFDEVKMKSVLTEFEIDTDKMPLGKISKKQIQKAYSVLTELQELLKKKNPERITLIDASNKFYNLIPHNFGIAGPKILDTPEEIHTKCEMLDALLEMEIAYSLLHGKTDQSKNPIDAHYEQLNAQIDVLHKESEDFKIIQQYVKNTHASTHTQYELDIEDVFVVKRPDEEKRYKPFKKLPNRKLLWHGSRTTNFAGILSQGLRIAPPEAPVTGYMFGKGIYFADMVSKSANYCCTNSENSTGLLLLCEVALGNMYERYGADYIQKLPKLKHSTLGRGKTHPDPECVHEMEDGVQVPYGAGVPVKLPRESSLLYNEYIVYDVAQVKVKYLLKMKFNYKE